MEVIRVYHEAFGGHLGANGTLCSISRVFYFPRMISRVKEYVKRCDVCFRAKRNKPLLASYTPILIHTLFRRWSIDHVGPMGGKKKYLLVLI